MDKKKKILITLIGTILIISILGFFVIRPLFAEIKSWGAKYQERSSLFERRDQLKEYLEELEENLEVIREKSPTLEAMKFDLQNAIVFIAALEEIAAKTNNWQELSVSSSSREKEKFPFQSYNVILKGSFPNLVRYLVHLENAKWLVDVDSLGISRIQKETTREKESPVSVLVGDVRTNLLIEVYTK